MKQTGTNAKSDARKEKPLYDLFFWVQCPKAQQLKSGFSQMDYYGIFCFYLRGKQVLVVAFKLEGLSRDQTTPSPATITTKAHMTFQERLEEYFRERGNREKNWFVYVPRGQKNQTYDNRYLIFRYRQMLGELATYYRLYGKPEPLLCGPLQLGSVDLDAFVQYIEAKYVKGDGTSPSAFEILRNKLTQDAGYYGKIKNLQPIWGDQAHISTTLTLQTLLHHFPSKAAVDNDTCKKFMQIYSDFIRQLPDFIPDAKLPKPKKNESKRYALCRFFPEDERLIVSQCKQQLQQLFFLYYFRMINDLCPNAPASPRTILEILDQVLRLTTSTNPTDTQSRTMRRLFSGIYLPSLLSNFITSYLTLFIDPATRKTMKDNLHASILGTPRLQCDPDGSLRILYPWKWFTPRYQDNKQRSTIANPALILQGNDLNTERNPITGDAAFVTPQGVEMQYEPNPKHLMHQIDLTEDLGELNRSEFHHRGVHQINSLFQQFQQKWIGSRLKEVKINGTILTPQEYMQRGNYLCAYIAGKNHRHGQYRSRATGILKCKQNANLPIGRSHAVSRGLLKANMRLDGLQQRDGNRGRSVAHLAAKTIRNYAHLLQSNPAKNAPSYDKAVDTPSLQTLIQSKFGGCLDTATLDGMLAGEQPTLFHAITRVTMEKLGTIPVQSGEPFAYVKSRMQSGSIPRFVKELCRMDGIQFQVVPPEYTTKMSHVTKGEAEKGIIVQKTADPTKAWVYLPPFQPEKIHFDPFTGEVSLKLDTTNAISRTLNVREQRLLYQCDADHAYFLPTGAGNLVKWKDPIGSSSDYFIHDRDQNPCANLALYNRVEQFTNIIHLLLDREQTTAGDAEIRKRCFSQFRKIMTDSIGKRVQYHNGDSRVFAADYQWYGVIDPRKTLDAVEKSWARCLPKPRTAAYQEKTYTDWFTEWQDLEMDPSAPTYADWLAVQKGGTYEILVDSNHKISFQGSISSSDTRDVQILHELANNLNALPRTASVLASPRQKIREIFHDLIGCSNNNPTLIIDRYLEWCFHVIKRYQYLGAQNDQYGTVPLQELWKFVLLVKRQLTGIVERSGTATIGFADRGDMTQAKHILLLGKTSAIEQSEFFWEEPVEFDWIYYSNFS
jgi:hypothetical protein